MKARNYCTRQGWRKCDSLNSYFYDMLLSHQDTYQINCPNEKKYSSTHQSTESHVSGITNAKVQETIDCSFYGLTSYKFSPLIIKVSKLKYIIPQWDSWHYSVTQVHVITFLVTSLFHVKRISFKIPDNVKTRSLVQAST